MLWLFSAAHLCVNITIGMAVAIIFHNLLSSLATLRYLFSFSMVCQNREFHILAHSLLVYNYQTKSSDLDWVIDLKSQKILCFILQDIFWSLYILLVCMYKIYLLAQIAVDCLTHPFYVLLRFIYLGLNIVTFLAPFCATIKSSLRFPYVATSMWIYISFALSSEVSI